MNKGQFTKGHSGHWLGKKMSLETKAKMRAARLGKPRPDMIGRTPWNKDIHTGIVPKSAFKKGAIPHNKLNRTPEELREVKRKYRKSNPSQFKAYDQNKRAKRKGLTASTIQMVYEDNIKKYGTLSCYLCLEPVPFGKDHLEHKKPLARGGSNEYDNLAVACQSCNCKKHTKTYEEYIAGVR